MNKKMIYISEGFTLIETVVSIALIASIMTVLSFGTASSYREYINSNAYKKESDIDLGNIQEPYTKDSTTLKKSVDYTMQTTMDGKTQSTALSMYNTTDTDPSISLSRFEAQASNFKKSLSIQSLAISAENGQLSPIAGLDDYTISSFDDLPSTNYDALDSMNKDWGIWSYVGWSLVYKNDTTWKTQPKTDTGIVMYRDIANNIKLFCGNPNPAPVNSNYEGLITSTNFEEIMKKVENGEIDLSHYEIVPAYLFSKDIEGTHTDTDLLNFAEPTIRESLDNRNITSLANAAAKYIKKNGVDSLNSYLTTDAQSAIFGKGLEILHFRENGWPRIATKYYGTGRGSSMTSYENMQAYQNITKMGDGSTYKTGFFDTVFKSIDYDLSKTDEPTDWRGINYKYNILLFGDKVADNNQLKNSMFMQINKENKTVRIWVGTVSSSWWTGTVSINSIGGNYDVTVSYA